MIIVIPVIFILVIILIALTSNSMLNLMLQNLNSNAKFCKENMDAWADNIISDLNIYREQIENGKMNEEQLYEFLKKTYHTHNAYPYGLYIGNDQGMYYDASGWIPGDNFVVTQRKWYVDGKDSRQFVIGEPYLDDMLKETCISFSGAVNYGKGNCVLSTDVYMDYAQGLVDRITEGAGVDGIIIVSKDRGMIVAHSGGKGIGTLLSQDNDFYQKINKHLGDDLHKDISISAMGTKYYMKLDCMDKTDWYIVSYAKASTVYLPLIRVVIVMVILAIIVIILLVYLISREATVINAVEEESDLRNRVSQTLSGIYIAVAAVDMRTGQFETIRMLDYIKQIIGDEMDARKGLEKAFNVLASEAYKPKIEEFIELSTLEARLHGKVSIVQEFFGTHAGWCRVGFVPMNYDSEGNLESVIFTVQRVDGEILSLREQLNIEGTLVACISALTANRDADASIQQLLANIAGYHGADRAYIRLFNNQQKMNDYEWCRTGYQATVTVDAMKDNFCDNEWQRILAQTEGIKLEPIDYYEKDSVEYKLLQAHGIECAMVVALKDQESIIGILGVDNPRSNTETMILMHSVSNFIIEELQKKEYVDELEELSYSDKMTGLSNRHAYYRQRELLENTKRCNIGIAFVDVNGLKQTNDLYGHEAGDELIMKAANVLKKHYRRKDDMIFRMGGDEFLVLSIDEPKEKFERHFQDLMKQMKNNEIFSMGSAWIAYSADLEEGIKMADSSMYLQKREYHNRYGKFANLSMHV